MTSSSKGQSLRICLVGVWLIANVEVDNAVPLTSLGYLTQKAYCTTPRECKEPGVAVMGNRRAQWFAIHAWMETSIQV